jgi:electron-transferring-flavoprotein dehydrogenase
MLQWHLLAGSLCGSLDLTRESLNFDVVIVGAGPSGLSAACRLAEVSKQKQLDLSIAVVEKGAEVGSHILSGAVIDLRALDELIPDWRERGAPVGVPVASESVGWMVNASQSIGLPKWLLPRPMRNHRNHIASLGRLCRWLAGEAEARGCDILKGVAATELIFDFSGGVAGVATGPMGIAADGSEKPDADPGYELHARYVLLAEGARGHLGKDAEARFDLRQHCDPQHFSIGFKEVWTVRESEHRPGHVDHTLGWPLDRRTQGGGFLYHAAENRVYVGFVVALNYRNPFLSPYEEFQRFKGHPRIRGVLASGSRIGFGARAISQGGLNSLPKLSFPGGLLIGCDAGFLNSAKIKGTHAAMKSGMLAADTVASAIASGDPGGSDLRAFDDAFRDSWLYRELYASRNFSAGIARLGTIGGAVLAFVEHNLLLGRSPVSLRNRRPDHATLAGADSSERIDYPSPDGIVSFDRLSSVDLANIDHDDNQPCHLLLGDDSIPIARNLPEFDEPAQRYCPAAVYEVVADAGGNPLFRINAGNCIHCKTCDIKDPARNIRWVPPEGGSGPKYADL